MSKIEETIEKLGGLEKVLNDLEVLAILKNNFILTKTRTGTKKVVFAGHRKFLYESQCFGFDRIEEWLKR